MADQELIFSKVECPKLWNKAQIRTKRILRLSMLRWASLWLDPLPDTKNHPRIKGSICQDLKKTTIPLCKKIRAVQTSSRLELHRQPSTTRSLTPNWTSKKIKNFQSKSQQLSRLKLTTGQAQLLSSCRFKSLTFRPRKKNCHRKQTYSFQQTPSLKTS